MRRPKCALLLFAVLPTIASAASSRLFSAWESFDVPQPWCERAIPLGVGREGFFEIANDVPGKEAYNRLIQAYRFREWKQLEGELAAFMETYEDTPLREAATFLEAQSFFDQSQESGDEKARVAEKKMREAMLLYPKSDFAALMSATAAGFWVRSGNFQRGLAMYEVARTQYPQSNFQCAFKLGMGEANFLLRNLTAARGLFEELLNTCQGARLKSAALVRIADIGWLEKKRGAEAEYERRLELDSPFIERFYQPLLANLGEIKYADGNFSGAEYYFKRYLKMERGKPDCTAGAAKRIADIYWRDPKKQKLAIGGYLSVSEASPETDLGRFSHAHALLIDPGIQRGADWTRRVRIVDELAEKITDEALRSRLYVEKGMVLIGLNEPTALGFLEKLRGKTKYDFEKGEPGRFLRARLLDQIREGQAPLENVYSKWLKGSPEGKAALAIYENQSIAGISEKLAKGEIEEALEQLEEWHASELWPGDALMPASAQLISAELLKAVYVGGKESKAAALVQKHSKTLAPLFRPNYEIVQWLADLQLGNKAQAGGWLKWERQLASTASKIPKNQTTLFHLATAAGLRAQGNPSGAEAALKGLKDPAWEAQIFEERIALAQEQGKSAQVFTLAKDQLPHAKAEERSRFLDLMKDTVVQARYWQGAGGLIEAAKTWQPDREKLAPYYLAAARGQFELGQFKQAIDSFETAFRLVPSLASAESHFRLAKCWLSQSKPEAARTELQKAVDLKDEFWSPLAKSEILLLAH
ncbi:tetratricopeptide repeat protein [bacterium]|nr:tetratricopeptide repeat protein [bacterium]